MAQYTKPEGWIDVVISGRPMWKDPSGMLHYPGGGGNAIPSSSAQVEDPYAAMMEQMGAAMEEQAAMQARYMEQASLLQQESLKQQEEAAKAARIESDKRPTDYAQANADDTARKQQLRRGLMSTFTRYGSGSGTKATKLGG